MTSLAIPNAIQLLRQRLTDGASVDDLIVPLRAMQQRGMSQSDLVVALERMRAANDVTERSSELEERCLLALDLVHGESFGRGLSWDTATQASVLLSRSLTRADLLAAGGHAVTASDMLPARTPQVNGDVLAKLVDAAVGVLRGRERVPVRATFVRVPKRGFTSRPAAVLAFPDRLVLEALADKVEPYLEDSLPPEVAWPRGRARIPHADVTAPVRAWAAEYDYVAKADIAGFYEVIDHSLLAVFLTSVLEIDSLTSRAVEATLGATMGLSRGLPQGPPASDVFASAFLCPVDREFARSGQPFVRYADDYFFPVSTVGQGREVLLKLEVMLNDLGLGLSPEKTMVMRAHKYEEGLTRPHVHMFKSKVVEQRLSELEGAEDDEERYVLAEGVGLDEQDVWDLLYHRSVDVSDVMAGVLSPSNTLGASHSLYLGEVARSLGALGDAAELPTLARVARESLIVLAKADGECSVEAADLDLIGQWFPELTPEIVSLIVSRAATNGEWSAEQMRRRIVSLSGDDWVDSWSAFGAGFIPAGDIKKNDLLGVLRSSVAGPLTRIELVRALLRRGELTRYTWRRAMDSVPEPLRVELLFSCVAEPRAPEWLRLPAIGASEHSLPAGN